MTMLTVTALPARYGDSLWIEYGPADAPRVLLVDAGPSTPDELRSRLETLKARNGRLELVVVTHIDLDHIGGMISLLRDRFLGVSVRDIWFNGYRHLPETNEAFGPKQGEALTTELIDGGWSWNGDFGGRGIFVDDTLPLPRISLALDASITLLSPDRGQLATLRDVWVAVCGDSGLYPDINVAAPAPDTSGDEAFGLNGLPDISHLSGLPFKEDRSPANGSSIAFIFEYEGKRVLFGADAFPSRLLKSLSMLEASPHDFVLVKLPHHGSDNNISVDLLEALRSPRYVFSTDGKKFPHPSPAGVARVIQFGQSPLLAFNYDSKFTTSWDPFLLGEFPFTRVYGTNGSLTLDLSD